MKGWWAGDVTDVGHEELVAGDVTDVGHEGLVGWRRD